MGTGRASALSRPGLGPGWQGDISNESRPAKPYSPPESEEVETANDYLFSFYYYFLKAPSPDPMPPKWKRHQPHLQALSSGLGCMLQADRGAGTFLWG